jgi:UDP-glucose 4-epimerase
MVDRFLVTGAAGFIGSHLCERLLADGHVVRGVDRFSTYYDREIKESNLACSRRHGSFSLVEADLATAELAELVDGVEAVFHLAAQPGVRPSWGDGFVDYVHDNVVGTQRLLEAVRGHPVPVVIASSSSVYGDAERFPVREQSVELSPVSPYGLTKLAVEHLARIYTAQHRIPTVALRYFTVYGPRQRPDMAFARLMDSALTGRPLRLFGDGTQSRDFTFVADAVDATVRALDGSAGRVYNVGGGEPTTLNAVVGTLADLIGHEVAVVREPAAPGDVRHTWAETSRARAELGWAPGTTLREGLAAQLAWLRSARDGEIRLEPAAPARKASVSGSTVRVLAYSHDGYGLGHLRRNLRIVAGLRKTHPELDALLVTGAKAAGRVVGPFGENWLRLPAVVKVANGRYVPDEDGCTGADVVRRRADLLVDAVKTFRPDLVLVDRYPKGMSDELVPALDVLRTDSPQVPVVLGLRDILDQPVAVRQEWHRSDHSAAIRELYRAVLIYGDRSVFDPIKAYTIPDEVAAKTNFTGYLADDVRTPGAEEVRQRWTRPGRRLALCTLGGGADSYRLAQAFLTACTRLVASGWDGLVITGPYIPADDASRLRAHPMGAAVPVVAMVEDLPSHLAAADAVVCMGGYNTICEVLAVGAAAVAVPRVRPRQEQLMRCEAFATRGLISTLHPDHLTPYGLVAAVERVAEQGRSEHAQRLARVAHGGISQTAARLGELLSPALVGSR